MILFNGQFWATEAQANVLNVLGTLRKGGIGTVKRYITGTGAVQDMQFISRFSTEALYRRKAAALAAVTFADVQKGIAKEVKLASLPLADQESMFDARKAQAVDSINKTLTGDRSDGHRQGHDRCYRVTDTGIKVNLDCEKVDGIQQPKLVDGYPVAESIMVAFLELNKTVHVQGVYKIVNSKPETIMGNLIESCLNARSVGYKSMSLKADNFETLTIDRQTIEPQDVEQSALCEFIMEAIREAA